MFILFFLLTSAAINSLIQLKKCFANAIYFDLYVGILTQRTNFAVLFFTFYDNRTECATYKIFVEKKNNILSNMNGNRTREK